MCLLRFFEEFTQFFWAAQDQIVYVNVATDLIHQAVASFGNRKEIRATVILGNRDIPLVEDSGDNINRFIGDIQCPCGEAMLKQRVTVTRRPSSV